MRHLRRAGQRHARAGGVPFRVRGARFHRRSILPVRANVDLDPLVRAHQFGVEARRFQAPFDHHVAGRLGVDERGAGSQCRLGADDRRHVFDVDLDEIGDVFGLFPARGDDRRERLADESDHILGQHRLADRHVVELVQHRLDRLHRGKVGSRDDRRALGCRDPPDPARGDRAPHKAHPACRRQVAGEAAIAGHQRRILEPPDRAADPAVTVILLHIDGHWQRCIRFYFV